VVSEPGFAERTWRVLDAAIDDIYEHNSNKLSFEELYRAGYNMVLQKCGAELYASVERKIRGRLEAVADGIAAKDGLGLVAETVRQWEDHVRATAVIRDILMYLDRTHVPQHNCLAVHALAMTLWRDGVIRRPDIQPRLVGTVLECVGRERAGVPQDRGLLREVVRMWASLGADVYAVDFEAALLQSSREFYAREAREMIESLSCPEYFSRVRQRLAEERERCQLYLEPSSEEQLVLQVRQELLQSRVQVRAAPRRDPAPAPRDGRRGPTRGDPPGGEGGGLPRSPAPGPAPARPLTAPSQPPPRRPCRNWWGWRGAGWCRCYRAAGRRTWRRCTTCSPTCPTA